LTIGGISPFVFGMVAVFGALVMASGISLLIAEASPFIVIYFRKNYSVEHLKSAKQHLGLSGFVILVVVLNVAGISFAHYGINIAVLSLVGVSVFFLALFSFKLKPRRLGVAVGLLSILGWVFVTLVLVTGESIDYMTAKTAEIEGGIHCRLAYYGFAGTEQGTTFKVFKRFHFIDKLIFIHRFSSFSPDEPSRPTGAEAEIARRCEVALPENQKTDLTGYFQTKNNLRR
jgi:hypothetical protein